MEKDLNYYQHRLAEEQAAEQSAQHPAVRAAHHELARGYKEQIAALEARSPLTPLHLVSAACELSRTDVKDARSFRTR
jgi:hypothetical protein